jgi:hypothetical protein
MSTKETAAAAKEMDTVLEPGFLTAKTPRDELIRRLKVSRRRSCTRLCFRALSKDRHRRRSLPHPIAFKTPTAAPCNHRTPFVSPLCP